MMSKSSLIRSDWEIIFAASPVNGGEYLGDELPVFKPWPANPNSWFRRRLAEVRTMEMEKGEVICAK